MESLPLHPKLVHVPLGVAVVLPLVALFVTVALRRGWLRPRAWVIVVGLQAVVAAGALAASRSGHQEEERVEEYVAERYIEAHEEAAELFFYASVGVLVLAIVAWIAPQAIRRWLTVATTIATVGVLALGVYTGQKGGELVYVHGAANVRPATLQGGDVESPDTERHREDDDD